MAGIVNIDIQSVLW